MVCQTWFKFFASDFLLDAKVDALPLEAQAILVRMWCLCARDGSIPDDPKSIARRSGVDSERLAEHWESVRGFFDPREDGLHSIRMDFENEAYAEKSKRLRERARKAGMASAAKRSTTSSTQVQQQVQQQVELKLNLSGEQQVELKSTEAEAEAEAEKNNYLPNGSAVAEPRRRRVRKPRFQAEDITPENAEYLRKVYDRAPTEHPVTEQPVHKGPFAEAARNFQAIVDSGEATPRELMAVGTVYYRAEILGETWVEAINRVWDSRPRAMMQVSTLYGPQKRAYRQLLPLARKLIEYRDAEAAKQAENVIPLEAAS